MKTYEKSTVINLVNSIEYSENGIVSKQITKNKVGNITIFSFDKGQSVAEHSANYNAFVLILDGEAEIFINKVPHSLQAGECIILPSNIPHSLRAKKRFKMLLTMIRGEE